MSSYDRLRDLLDREIDALTAEDNRGGMTIWVLLAALAATLALIVDGLGGSIDAGAYKTWCVALSFGLYLFVVAIGGYANEAMSPSDPARVGVARQAFLRQRGHFVVMGLLMPVLGWMAWSVRAGVSSAVAWTAVLVAGVVTAGVVFVVIISFLDLYIPGTREEDLELRWRALGFLIVVSPAVVVFLGYGEAAAGLPVRETLDELRRACRWVSGSCC